MIERKCPVCGDPILGRIDKKYCGDQCRHTGNQEKRDLAEMPVAIMNKTLRKNRRILKTLCPAGKTVVRKDVLDALQYDDCVFTSIFVTNKKQIYYLCYDYGFTPILENGEKKALIIKRQDYMQQWDPWKYAK